MEASVDPLPRKTGSVDVGVGVSFTTGPQGKATHWKQVVFLLREPITLKPGQLFKLAS